MLNSLHQCSYLGIKKGVIMQRKARSLRENQFVKSRSAQGGMNAAILVAIIAGLIILYIIFLPAAEREKLINEREDNTGTGQEAKSNYLLQVFPGSLSSASNLENEKTIPNMFLVETTNAKELENINPFIVRNGWFDKKEKKIDFELDDIDNTDNVILSFTTKKRQGTLTITLNGVVIFENEIATETIEPVRLSKKLLSKSNSLDFAVSSVGAKFWTTNEYSLENVKIIGDITDTSKQESTNLFTIGDAEFSSMEKASLKFIPYCSNVNMLGTLDIWVNNRKIFSLVPVCDRPYRQDIPKSALSEGENNIVFKTNKGSYSVEQIKIALDFKEPTTKTYFFEINQSLFKKVKSGDKSIQATIKFADDKKQKNAKLDVNNKLETIQTDKMTFTRIINNKVSEGNNFIRLEPLQEDLGVVELRVEIV